MLNRGELSGDGTVVHRRAWRRSVSRLPVWWERITSWRHVDSAAARRVDSAAEDQQLKTRGLNSWRRVDSAAEDLWTQQLKTRGLSSWRRVDSAAEDLWTQQLKTRGLSLSSSQTNCLMCSVQMRSVVHFVCSVIFTVALSSAFICSVRNLMNCILLCGEVWCWSQHQKGKTILDFTGARDGVAVASAGPYCKSFAPRSRQIAMPVPHHSVFTGQMPFLPPNQQCQSTEGQHIDSNVMVLLGIVQYELSSEVTTVDGCCDVNDCDVLALL